MLASCVAARSIIRDPEAAGSLSRAAGGIFRPHTTPVHDDAGTVTDTNCTEAASVPLASEDSQSA